MKRLLAAFGLALTALTFGLGSQPASAVPIPTNCAQVAPGATTSWPGYIYSLNCAATTGQPATDAQAMEQAAGQNPGAANNNLASSAFQRTDPNVANYFARGLYLFLYETPSAYTTALGSDAATVPAGAWGVTKLDPTNKIPMHIAIFRTNSAGVANPSIQNSTAYQIATAFDSLLGYVRNGGFVTLPYPILSDSVSYTDQYNYDWQQINAITPQCGPNGLFTGRTDPSKTTTTYICNGTNGQGSGLNTGYSGNNQTILAQILPTIFKNAQTLWSAEYANIHYPTAPYYYYLGKGFACTAKFQNIVTNYGRQPVATDYPSGCPTTFIVHTNCIRIFSALPGRIEGQFGYGNVFDCGPGTGGTIGTGQGSNVATALSKLGQIQVTSDVTTAIQKTLITGYGFVHLYTDADAYHAAVQQAAVFDDTALGNDTGTTTPYKKVLYANVMHSTLDSAGNPVIYNTAQTIENADHETGHLADFALNQRSSRLTIFGTTLAYNDIAKLDYLLPLGNTEAASTPRLPCSTTQDPTVQGPLVGVIDQTTITPTNPNGSPYCNGAGGFNNSTYNGHLTHEVLLMSSNFGNIGSFTPPQTIGDVAYNGGFAELFAQAFRDRASFDTGGGGLGIGVDGIWAKNAGWLACSAGHAVLAETSAYLGQIYNGSTNPTTGFPSGCTTAIKAWFAAKIGQ